MSTGPPFERLYAVEPDGVEQMIPSHGWRPSSSSPTASSSSIMRPSEALDDDDVVHGDGASVRVLELERRQLDDVVLAREDAPEPSLEVSSAHRAEKADAAEVDADDRNARPEEARERAQDGAVAAEHDREVGGHCVRARVDAVLRRLLVRCTGARRRAPARRPAAWRARIRSGPACRASPRPPGSTRLPDGVGDKAV